MISKFYVARKLLMIAIPVSLILTTVAYSWLGWESLILLLFIPAMGWYFWKWQKNFRYRYNDKGIQVRSGVWGRRYTILSWNKVQQVEQRRSLYQERKDLLTIIFHTAGGVVQIPFVPVEEGNYLTDLVLYYVESSQEKWT